MLDASDPGEPLPPDWQTAGTTGYETLTVINGLIVDPAGEKPLSLLYTELTGETADFAAVAEEGRRLIARDVLATEVTRLTGLLGVRLDRSGDTATESGSRLRDALVDVLCRLEVYRPFASSPRTLAALDDATAQALQARAGAARRRSTPCEPTPLTPTSSASDSVSSRLRCTQRASRTPPSIAMRGCLSLNEVGGDPGQVRPQPGELPSARRDPAGRLTDRHDDAVDA